MPGAFIGVAMDTAGDRRPVAAEENGVVTTAPTSGEAEEEAGELDKVLHGARPGLSRLPPSPCAEGKKSAGTGRLPALTLLWSYAVFLLDEVV